MLPHSVTTTADGAAPLTGAEMLTHLRLGECEATEEAEFDNDHIPEAISWLESELRTELQQKSVVEEVELEPCWNEFPLSRRPVTDVAAMELFDTETETWTELDATKYEIAYKPGQAAYIRRKCDSDCSCCLCAGSCPDLIRVTYTAGFTAATLPAKYKRAIKWMAAHLYTFREPVTEGRIAEIPLGLQRIIALLKRRRVIV